MSIKEISSIHDFFQDLNGMHKSIAAWEFVAFWARAPPPTSFRVTACCDAEWRLLVKLTDSPWQPGQSAADAGRNALILERSKPQQQTACRAANSTAPRIIGAVFRHAMLCHTGSEAMPLQWLRVPGRHTAQNTQEASDAKMAATNLQFKIHSCSTWGL